VARFTEEDDFLDIFGLQNFIDFREVLVVGLVTATDNNNDFVIWERVDGHAGGAGVGREIIVVVSDTAKLADEFEAVREAFETG